MIYERGRDMSEGIKVNEDDIEFLKVELQQQRGMLWLLGEIMKASINMTSFKQLMIELTDMLMGVMGVTTCYLWIKIDSTNIQDYTVFFRSIELMNEFKEIKESIIPKALQNLNETHLFSEDEIADSLMECIKAPCSRLAVPLKNFEDNSNFGVLVLEHEEKDFFTNNTIAFFETLTIFIASHAQNSKLFQSVTEKSLKDPLTGTYNRRHLSESLRSLKEKYKHISVAVIDTDNFKSINDGLGHIEGDAVLKAIAQLAKGIVEDCDGEVIRYGGDEFVILIPRPLAEAVHIFEEFRKSVHYLKVAYDLATQVSVTLGVCSYPEIIQNYDQVIKAADKALLRGKVQGKDRVILASDEDIELD